MDDFSKFIQGVRLSCDNESPLRKFADAVSTADTLKKYSFSMQCVTDYKINANG